MGIVGGVRSCLAVRGETVGFLRGEVPQKFEGTAPPENQIPEGPCGETPGGEIGCEGFLEVRDLRHLVKGRDDMDLQAVH